MTVAILGAGILGSCTALELADRGHHVVLYERNAEPWSEASLHNEGKLHLGFVYAADPTFRTADRMLRGAARFLETLARWVPGEALQAARAPAFDYVVHRDTMIPVDGIERHFARVASAMAEQASGQPEFTPVDPTRPSWRRISEAELQSRYSPELVLAAYETNEIAVDPWTIAPAVRQALRSHPRVELRPGTRVLQAVDAPQGRFDVVVQGDGEGVERRDQGFRAVVNALWTNRPITDRRYGLAPGDPWYTRFKLGVNLLLREPPPSLPGFTVLLGPFGDVVPYRTGRVYMSWYPDCMIGTSIAVEDISWDAVMASVDQDRVRRRTVAALSRLCPALAALDGDHVDVVVNGGAIFALGATDIDDPASRLHERTAAQTTDRERYLSVDTSKFTLGPAMALETAARVDALVPRSTRAGLP